MRLASCVVGRRCQYELALDLHMVGTCVLRLFGSLYFILGPEPTEPRREQRIR